MDNTNIYKNNLSRAFDYLLNIAENNGFYGPTRQEVCKVIYDKKNRNIENMQLAIRYLQRRFKEQDLDVFLFTPICEKVLQSEPYKARWQNNEIVLATGEILNDESRDH